MHTRRKKKKNAFFFALSIFFTKYAHPTSSFNSFHKSELGTANYIKCNIKSFQRFTIISTIRYKRDDIFKLLECALERSQIDPMMQIIMLMLGHPKDQMEGFIFFLHDHIGPNYVS